MNICFYNDHPYWGQLANNGGTRTILKMAQALRNIGHNVCVVARKDRFTWFDHPKALKRIPGNTDLCVAVSISDVTRMIKRAPKHSKLGYFGRPVETWSMTGVDIQRSIASLYNNGGRMICNSQWQTDYWTQKGFECYTVYAGLDFGNWSCEGRPKQDKVTVGFLVHEADRKNFKAIKNLVKELGNECTYFALGSRKTVHNRIRKWLHRWRDIVTFVEDPSHDDLANMYRKCSFWFAPTKLEGFHNPPAEASLCGAQVVCSKHPRNGCLDYCSVETATLVDTIGEAGAIIAEGPEELKNKLMRQTIRLKIGTREENAKRLVEILTQ